MRPHDHEGPPRLRESEPATATERLALDALRAVPPFVPTTDERRRRLAQIEARIRSDARSRRLTFRPAVALVLLLAGTGAVAATAGRPALVAAYDRVATLWRHDVPGREQPRVRARPSVESAEPTIDPAPVNAPPRIERRPRPAGVVAKPAPHQDSPPAASAPRPEDELQLVYDAMVALRKRGDRVAAAKLSFAYLERHPTGPMAEEALEIAREALSQSDPARARELAREYLRRFPRGVYRSAAERTIADEVGRR